MNENIIMNYEKEKKKCYFWQPKSVELLHVWQIWLALSLSMLGRNLEAASLRHEHAACFSSFVDAEDMICFKPWQQEVAGASVFLVRKSKHGANKDFSWSQVKPFDDSWAAANTTSRVKNVTNTIFIFIHSFISLIHSCVLILDGWNTEGDVIFIVRCMLRLEVSSCHRYLWLLITFCCFPFFFPFLDNCS